MLHGRAIQPYRYFTASRRKNPDFAASGIRYLQQTLRFEDRPTVNSYCPFGSPHKQQPFGYGHISHFAFVNNWKFCNQLRPKITIKNHIFIPREPYEEILDLCCLFTLIQRFAMLFILLYCVVEIETGVFLALGMTEINVLGRVQRFETFFCTDLVPHHRIIRAFEENIFVVL